MVSAASAWEIATKYRLGKLSIGAEILHGFDELVTADGFSHLAINYRQPIHAGAYPQDHRGPFDHILAAQAELERVPLVAGDPVRRDSRFSAFGSATQLRKARKLRRNSGTPPFRIRLNTPCGNGRTAAAAPIGC